MRVPVVVVLLLAVFGASTQCVADCLTQQSAPPCHQHSKGKNSAPERCNHAQPVADAQATCPPAAESPALAEIACEVFAPAIPQPDNAQLSLSVLRL